MKLKGLAIVALAAGSLFVATPAAAQRHVEVHRTVTTTTTVNGGYNHDRRWNKHHRHHKRKICRRHWVNHHRVTRCWWR
ncbi:MAG TPA: hypothetical protein VNT42_08565 [Sphingomonas sp.]|nr:hypothetical protein [Sphingomonas sp.]